jgi:sigma-B regulation protein RsbU (phosphoserine phosphatase)
MEFSFRYLRIQLAKAGLWPTTRLPRIACYFLAVDVLLLMLQTVLQIFGGSGGSSLEWWVRFLTFVLIFLFLILSYRWLKAKLLWRLRNRLIVTYIFIGVVPASLLVTMAVVTLSLFAGQFANFVATAELNSRLRSLGVVNSGIAHELASKIEGHETITPGFLESLRQRDPSTTPHQVCAWNDGQSPVCSADAGSKPFSSPPNIGPGFEAIVQDEGKLYLRSAAVLDVNGHKLAVVSSVPLDIPLLKKIAADLGEITLYATPPGSNGTLENGQGVRVTAGILPTPSGNFDREIEVPPPLVVVAPLLVVDWKTGNANPLGGWVHVRTRPSTLYARLFAATDFVKGMESVLLILGIIFAIIVGLALIVGTRLTRTVTRAVAQLYLATRHINRGDFSHRIPVTSNDQLATLSHSFNSMSESLQKLIEEQKEKQKLENELVIAQEVQAQLFPRHIAQLQTLEVHGFCRPARTVSGDYYDFLTVDPDRMVMAVGDVSGKGISAALLMATIHSAVRAYSLEGIPILRESLALAGSDDLGLEESRALTLAVPGVEVSTAALLTLLNHQLFESTPSEKYATMFLSFYDGRERRLTYTNAGHLPPIILSPDGSIRRLDCGGTVVGLFPQVSYEENTVRLADGEIFLAYSDGVTEPENDYGEFGEQRLIELVWENRQLPLARISEVVTAAVDDWIGANEQPDDVTLVLARAR